VLHAEPYVPVLATHPDLASIRAAAAPPTLPLLISDKGSHVLVARAGALLLAISETSRVFGSAVVETVDQE
jgi:hypothetical protein